MEADSGSSRRAARGDGTPLTTYERMIDAAESGGGAFVIDRDEVPDYFVERPVEVIENMSETYRSAARSRDGAAADKSVDWTVRMRLDPGMAVPVASVGTVHNGKWVEIRGIVAAMQRPAARITMAAWTCGDCHIMVMYGAGDRPRACKECKSRGLVLDTKASRYEDVQRVWLAGLPGDPGGVASRLRCTLAGHLAGTLGLGRRCVLGGVLVLEWSGREWTYNLNVNNTAALPASNGPRAPDIGGRELETLAASLAPGVPGQRAAKEAIMLVLAGGSGGVAVRGEISALLVGDTHTAGTLMEAAVEAAPAGMRTGAAVAADIVADAAIDRERAVEAGPVVLMGGGLLCVDDVDILSADRLTGLYEAIDRQSVSPPRGCRWLPPVTAGVSVLASAASLRPNGMPPMFDVMLDLGGGSRFAPGEPLPPGAPDLDTLKRYVAAVRGLKPELSEESWTALDALRVTMEPRRVNAAARFAGAHAKICRRKNITADDVKAAVRMVEASRHPAKTKKS